MTDNTMIKTIFIAASPDIVWEYLTDKDKLAIWFHPAEADFEAGKPYALVSKNDDGTSEKICWGDVLKMDRPKTLVYTFTIKPLGGAETTVTWTLEATYGGTRLLLEHSGIDKAAGEAALGLLMALDAGWDKHFAALREAAVSTSAEKIST